LANRKLTPAGGKVELVDQASKGETVIQIKLADPCRARVARVLSTGEQAAVATAFFLAELAVTEGRSCVVLDDPVPSLDHDHREYFARRLVEEAKKRQVVIYTHDVTFVYYLQEAAEEEGVELHGQTLERRLDRVGVVRDELPIKSVSPSRRRKELRHRLNYERRPLHKRDDPAYEAQADSWVVDLRMGYDQLIEEYLLPSRARTGSRTGTSA
jgi:ABC-type multidrug transport system ATPase subunit